MTITDKYVAALGEIAELKRREKLILELFNEHDGALEILRDFDKHLDGLTDEDIKAIEEKNKNKKYGFEPHEEKECDNG